MFSSVPGNALLHGIKHLYIYICIYTICKKNIYENVFYKYFKFTCLSKIDAVNIEFFE